MNEPISASGGLVPAGGPGLFASSDRPLRDLLPVFTIERGPIRFGPAENPTWWTGDYGRDDVDLWGAKRSALKAELGERVWRGLQEEEGLRMWEDDYEEMEDVIQRRGFEAEMARCGCRPCRVRLGWPS